MGFFSMEHTGFKTWLVANQKIWGLVPVGICWAVAVGMAFLFGKNEDAASSMAAYLLMGAFLVSIAFTAAETNEKPNLIYTIIALAPIVFMVLVMMGKFSHTLITTGVIIWTIVSILIGLFCGFIIRKYSLVNYYETVSKIFKLRSSIDIWSSEQTFAYRRAVEAFMYSFTAVEMFSILFV